MSLKYPSLRYAIPVAINLASVVISFTIRAYLAKTLTASAFGAFSIWYNNVLFFGGLGTIGAQTYAIKELAKTDGTNNRGAFHTTLNLLLSVLIFSAVLAALGAVFQTGFQKLDLMLALSLVAAAISYSVLTLLSAFHRSFNFLGKGMSFDRLFYQVSFSILLLSPWAFLATDTPEISFSLFMIAAMVASLLFYWSYSRSHALSNFHYDGLSPNTKKLTPYFLSFLFVVINSRYMLSMSGVLLSGDYLGEISFLFTLFSTLPFITVTINLAIGPLLARWIQRPHENGNYRKITIVLMVTSFLIIVGAVIMALLTPTIYRLFDLKLTMSYTTILFFAIASAVKAIMATVIFIREIAGDLRSTLFFCLVVLVAKLILGYFAMREYGLLGLSIVDIVLTFFILGHILSWIWKLARDNRESIQNAP